MKDREFLDDYFSRYDKSLFNTDIYDEILALKKMLLAVKKDNKKVMIAGNGGSAAMASHVTVDFTKQGGVRTVNFNESDLITCFANDYGYEHWIEKAIEFYGDENDLVILISSSGRSVNMINAAKFAKNMGLSVVTFTGFDSDNPLKKEGDLNFWLDSRAYNIVENIHQIWLLMVCDLLIGKIEYSA